MNFEETEPRNDCGGEGQQQFNRATDRVSSFRELQMKGASQRGQEPLDTEVEDATLLEATTRQRD
jgi:hypothetical protein